VNSVILDGYILNPGDLSWDAFHSLGDCKICDRTSAAQVVEQSSGYDILLTTDVPITREMIAQLPDLKYIGVFATGFDYVDIKAAAEQGIVVTNVPEYGTHSVAQMVFAHLLNLCQHTADHSTVVRQGDWNRSADFSTWKNPLIELSGLTMGIVGMGRIGSEVARIARAFGMNVLAFDTRPAMTLPEGIIFTDIETIFQQSDVVSLHCPLTEENPGFVNKQLLDMMKPSAFLINTSRGKLIDESALAEALNSGVIAGAGLDVLSQEPPEAGNPLLKARNCDITPHIAWATRSARERLMEMTFQNVKAFIDGQPINVVNGI
jgi:glycerate dehydrogenase